MTLTQGGPASGVGQGSGSARRWVVLAVVAALAVAAVRGLLVQSFVIPSGSMQPTLQVGDRVLVSRPAYRLGEVSRGDVVVFDGVGVFDPQPELTSTGLARAGRAAAAGLGVPVGARDYVKRVVGLPGERVRCCDEMGRITVDGRALDERYVQVGDTPSDMRFDVLVPPGRVWVMGDHRSASADSRTHQEQAGGGTVPTSRIVGRVVAVYWPLERAGRVPRADPVARDAS